MTETTWTPADESDALPGKAVHAFGYGARMGAEGESFRPLPTDRMNQALADPGRTSPIHLTDWVEVGWMLGQNDTHPIRNRRSLMVGDQVRVIVETEDGRLVEVRATVAGMGFEGFETAPCSREALAAATLGE